MKKINETSWTLAPMRFRTWLKAIACILSTLLILYAIPTNIYAELIDTIEDAAEDAANDVAPSESQDETTTGQGQEGIIGELEDTQEADAVWEVTERREENVKHFRLSDGSYTAVQYTMPVHEKDDNGVWQDIDRTLTSSGSEYQTPDAKIKFVKKTTGNETLFTLHDGSRKITMSLVGANKKVEGQVTNTQTEFAEDATQLQKMMTLDKLSSKILYPDILDDVDLEYVVQSRNIKENIIVKERGDEYNFVFEIKLNNLDAVLREDGAVSILDPKTDEVVYTIPQGFMYDANGAYSDAVVYVLTNEGNGKYTLTVSADEDWINEDGRAFPVVVDPPINAVPDTANIVDTYIDSANPNSLYYNFSFLASGIGNYGQEFISYWETDTLTSIPNNAYIVSAEFSLYCQDYRPHSGQLIDLRLGLYQVTSNWTSNITWNKYSSGTMGAFSENELIDYMDLDGDSESKYVSWDITRLYRLWHSDADANHGVAIARLYDHSNESTPKVDALLSSLETSKAPRLVVNYRDMKGVETYWSGSSHSAGMAGTGFVNHATGNLVFSIGTLNTGDALFDFTPTLVYNSAIANQYNTYSYNSNVHYKYVLAGYGFKLNTNESIVERTYTDENGDTQTFYVLADSDGTEHYFLKDEVTQKWKDEDGLGLILTVDDSNSKYWIEDQNHNRMRFTKGSETSYLYAGGILEHIEDKYGNKLRFNYNSKGQTTNIDIVPSGHSTDNAIQYLTLSYNSIGLLYRIQNVVTGQVITFEYSISFANTSSTSVTNAGALGKVSYGHMENNDLVTDATMTYTYTNEAADGIYRLASAKDETSGTEIRYTYDAAGRVQTVSEYANNTMGQSIGFEYGADYTEVRTSGKNDALQDVDDIITKYMLDYEGRTVGVYSTDVTGTTMYGATSGAYDDGDDSGNSKNSLKESAVTNSVAVNYIQNGGFEHGNAGWGGITGNTQVVNGYDSLTRCYQFLSMPITGSQKKAIYQYVSLPNGTYTLSALVNGTTNANATVNLRVESIDTGEHIYETQYLLSTDHTINNNHTPTLTFTSDGGTASSEKFNVIIEVVGNTSSSGTVFIDSVMLEKSIGVGAFNMLQYGGFDETTVNANGVKQNRVETYWTSDTPTDVTDVSYGTGGIGGSNALKIEGNVNGYGNEYPIVFQTIPMEVTWNTSYVTHSRTFTLSGFAQGSHQVANENAHFAIDVRVNYTNGSYDYLECDFNKEIEDWQFLSRTFTTQEGKLIESIDVICVYAYQPGTAYFDNISLIEETGNNTARYAYTENGLLEFKYTPSVSEYYLYDDDNNLITFYDSQGNGCAYVYDDNNTLISQTTFKYDPNSTSDNNLNWWYLYRRYNGVTWSPATTAISKTEYTINQYGLNTQTVSYAASGNKNNATQATSTKKLVSSSTYQLARGSTLFGKVLTATDTSGNTTKYTYNTKGQLTHERRADNSGLYYEYDALGRMTNVYPLTYYMGIDLLYYPIVITTEEKAVYDYNPNHSLNTVSTTSTVYSFAYDDFGNTTAIMVGEGDTAVALATYQYADNNGKLMSMTYGNGKVMTYTYDELDRVSEICYTDRNNIQQYYRYTYTADGLVHTVESTEAGRMYRYNYNTKGQLTGSTELNRTGTDANGQPIYDDLVQSEYWYDAKDRIDMVQHHITYALSSGESMDVVFYGYTYNDSGAETLSAFNAWGVGGAEADYTYTYDELYRQTSKKLSIEGGYYQEVSYTYRNQSTSTTTGQIGQSVSKVGNATDGVLSQTTYTYEYDSRGNITKITDSAGNITRYTYDDMGQLTREDNPYMNKSYTYTYDTAGNRTSKKTYAYTTGTLGTATATQTLTYSTGEWGDQRTSSTYDAVGNPLFYNGYTMIWRGRQLVCSFLSTSVALTVYLYTYNDEGIRTSKSVNGIVHNYTLDGSTIISEQWDTHLMVFLYDESGAPIGLQYRNTSYAEGEFDTYYFEKNIFGDVVGIYSDGGSYIGGYTYDAWGNFTTTVESGTDPLLQQIVINYNPFRYRGYYYDTHSGLYYLQSRYYDPSTGRFINADGYINGNGDLIGYNMYAYCSNNPVMNVDPTGESILATILIGALVGAVLSGGFNLGSQLIENGGDIENVDWGSVVNSTLVGGALGASTALGVAYLGPVIAGVGGVTGSSALTALGISTGVSFLAGAGGYLSEELINGRTPDIGNAVAQGSFVAVEGMWNFGIGGLLGSTGTVGQKGRAFTSLEWYGKMIFGLEFQQPFKWCVDNIRENI